MSVKMALAKLCAVAAGGALIGGGAVHVAERAQTKRVYSAKVKQTKPVKRVVKRRPPAKVAKVSCPPGAVAHGYTYKGGKRVLKCVTTTTKTEPPVVTVTTQGAPIPLPPPYVG